MPTISDPVKIGPEWLFRRELGMRTPLGSRDLQARQCYFSMDSMTLYNDNKHGGIFSLEYSPEGSILVAACERKSILIFDPFNPKLVNTTECAHEDCVNCIKFLDSNTFATCSDDYTVAIWDMRNMSKKKQDLKGHENWVKSIEYSVDNKLLVTSGFDGCVLSWDLAKNSENENKFRKIFLMNGLMRSRLSPDGSKMVISTTAGYLIVIHNLDLTTLEEDLKNFKPNMYRLMQLSQTLLPATSDFTHMFRGAGKRNRIEFICDFPDGNDAEVIASIQIHPDGLYVLSRNTSHEETSEWTTVHSLEECLSSDDSEGDSEDEQVRWPDVITKSTRPSYVIRSRDVHQDDSGNETVNEESGRDDLTFSPSDVWEAVVAIQDARQRREQDRLRVPERLPNVLVGYIGQPAPPRESSPASSHAVRAYAMVVPPPSYNAAVRGGRSREDPGEGTSQQNGSGIIRRPRGRGRPPKVRNARRGARAVETADEQSWGPSGRRLRSSSLRTRYELNETARLQNRWSRGGDLRSLESADGLNRDIVFSPRRGASPAADAPSEFVLPLGVFRRAGSDGGRGTSMRRHNIATLRIASSDGDSDSEPLGPQPRYLADATHDLTRVRINKNIHQNIRRLTHFIREPNVIRGFIKEPCFSPDGRVICSPYKHGIRLLAFSPSILQPWQCFPKKPPIPLYEVFEKSVGSTNGDVVVSTKFSTMDNHLVIGSLSGKIELFNPFR